MKARSVVFTHVQQPFTVFGLPTQMVGLSVTAAVVVFMLTLVAGAVAVSMIAFGLTLGVGVSVSYRLGRADRHVETVAMTSLKFWGLSSRRWLLAGAAPDSRSLEGRS